MNGSIELVLLDRDGVINDEAAAPILSPEGFRFLPGSLEAIVSLSTLPLKIAVVTNQACIARGAPAEAVQRVHAHLKSTVQGKGAHLSGIFMCPHDDADRCECRKPKPGLLIQAMRATGRAPERALLIGDAERDLLAARSAGVRAVLVGTGKGEATRRTPIGAETPFFSTLADAARAIVRGEL